MADRIRRPPTLRQLTVVIILATWSATGAAQSPQDHIPGISVGQNVVVRTSDGRHLKGRIESTDSGTVTVVNATHKGLFRREEIELIELQRDRLWNGTLAGLGVGVLVGALASDITQFQSPFCVSFCGQDNKAMPMFLGGAVGALLGSGIDALIFKRDRTLYRRSPRVMLVPTTTRDRQHLAVSVVW